MEPRNFDFTRLTLAERLELVEELWDSIAIDTDSQALPLSTSEIALLDERLADLERHPDAGRPWSEVRAEILAKRRP